MVVGASHAAVALADRLRAGGHRGTLTLIGSERHLPYQRPPLSKAFLKGDADVHALALRDIEFFRSHGIALQTGERVVDVRRGKDGSGVLHTLRRHGSADEMSSDSYAFDRLVLATGARPRRLLIPGAGHRNVLALRDLDDAARLRDRIHRGPVVVIGGGFIGLEAAATIKALGGEAVVVEAGPQLMGRAVGADTAAWCAAAHRAMGIGIELLSRPEAIVTDGDQIIGVRLDDGRRIAAATVLIGIGVLPRDELARALGLECADAGGVVVDEHCLASDGVTVAIGDCTIQPRPGVGDGSLIRLESVDNSDEQAARATCTLLGTEPTARSVPWFWSDQGTYKLQMAGLVGDHDDVVLRTDPIRPDRRVFIYLRAGTMTAVECVNSPADFLVLRKALSRQAAIPREVLEDNSSPLKKLLATAQV